MATTNRYGRRAGFGRGTSPVITNVPIDVLARMDAREMQGLLRDIRGRFIERGQVAQLLAEAHRQMAVSAGEFMARAYGTRQGQIGRPQNRQHYFRKAIRDPGNRIATATGWGVGLPEHYDSSPARRYWRFIEQGGENPMAAVIAKGAIGGFFWNPYKSPPNASKFRDHGRFRWRYLKDIQVPAKLDLQNVHPGATLGVPPSQRGDYTEHKYPIAVKDKSGNITGFRTVRLYFRKAPSQFKRLGQFGEFEGYFFHGLGAERFLAARTPADVYRRVFGGAGVAVSIT